jgi:NitT/TauT family transport system ATP-binding protein
MTGGSRMRDTAPITAAIDLRSVSKTYPGPGGGVRAVDDVSLSVAPREFVSVLGPSGCGKSTILRIIGGLQGFEGGHVRVSGRDVSDTPKEVAIVFQKSNLLAWLSVAANLGLGARIAGAPKAEVERRVGDMVTILGLDGFENRYPHELSGGMQQRACLGQALVTNPEILLLDEPFGALDALTRDRLNLELLRIWEEQRQTVFLVTHSISEAVFLSDRVIVMSSRPGRIIEDLVIDLPRPRGIRETRSNPRFAELVNHLSEVMGIV